MTCADAAPLLDAYFDSELDLTASLNVERHVSSCLSCSTTIENLKRLRAELTADVFDLRGEDGLTRLAASVRRNAGLPSRKPLWSHPGTWGAVAATLLLALLVPALRRDPNEALTREVVDSHIRSLVAEHLVDVPSSDQHTVKPWFQGKIDFAPDVLDLGSQGYPLVGGRLDVLSGRPAAALVYKHGGHYINIWTARAGTGKMSIEFSTLDGYQIAHWSSNSLDRWAVTDMNRTDLRAFIELLGDR